MRVNGGEIHTQIPEAISILPQERFIKDLSTNLATLLPFAQVRTASLSTGTIRVLTALSTHMEARITGDNPITLEILESTFQIPVADQILHLGSSMTIHCLAPFASSLPTTNVLILNNPKQKFGPVLWGQILQTYKNGVSEDATKGVSLAGSRIKVFNKIHRQYGLSLQEILNKLEYTNDLRSIFSEDISTSTLWNTLASGQGNLTHASGKPDGKPKQRHPERPRRRGAVVDDRAKFKTRQQQRIPR